MLKIEFPLVPENVELSEFTMRRLDNAVAHIEDEGGSLTRGIDIVCDIASHIGSFIGENTDKQTADAIRESLTANMNPVIAEGFKNMFELGQTETVTIDLIENKDKQEA